MYKRFAKLAKQILTFSATDTTKSFIINRSGEIPFIRMLVPNFTNVVTATLTVENGDGDEIWNSGAKAKNATYLMQMSIPIATETNTVKVTLSGAAGGTGGDVLVTVYLEV